MRLADEQAAAARDPGASVDAVVVGAGFAGLYALHKLRSLGFAVRGFETGADVGGTWFWNRYPGARCDVESMDYSYSFDDDLQQEWPWTERFASQPEIQRYLAHVADRFDLRSLIGFDTRVTAADWSDEAGRWRVHTDRGDDVPARYLILATGSLSAAKTPDIPGLATFAGDTFATSSWPEGGVDFTGRRVGVIGTGSSAIQAIPLIAEQAAHLTVFQRTPSFSLPARNRPLTADYVADFKRGYGAHRARMRVSRTGTPFFTTGQAMHEVSVEERDRVFEEAWARGGAGLAALYSDTMIDRAANDAAADFVRRKIAETVADPGVASALTPRDFPIGSKRVAVDTDYYATFNRANVTLEDVRANPIERVVPAGVQTSRGVVGLDALVLATGFDAMTGSFLRIAVRGTDGAMLADRWAAGPRTYLGLMSEGFPNLFFIAGPGSPSVLSNNVVSIEQHVEWIADCLTMMRNDGLHRIEAEHEAEADWVGRVNAAAEATLFMAGDSWYLGANVVGKPRVFMPFVGGVDVYRQVCDQVAADGYRGFALS